MVDVGVHKAFTQPPSSATITDWMLKSMDCIPEGMNKKNGFMESIPTFQMEQ